MQNVLDRHSRHILLSNIGEKGQELISEARVLVAGVGALGSMISILLARAGVGFIRIVDYDKPEMHNLHRQIIFTESDTKTGAFKADAAAEHLREANSQIIIEPVNIKIDDSSAERLVKDVDIVLDALDNTPARYSVNDAAVRRSVPYVFGGAVHTVGNVMTILPGKTACLRCLWPDPLKVADHARASTVGVLSTAATLTASIQVTEALKCILGKYDDLIDGMLVMDIWRTDFHVVPIKINPSCICGASLAVDNQ